MFPVGPCWRVVFNTDRQGFLPGALWQGFISHTSGLVNVPPLWQHLQFPSDRYPVTMVSYTGRLFTHEVCRSSRQREQVRTTKVPGVMEHLVLTLLRKPQWEVMFPCFPSPKADSCCFCWCSRMVSCRSNFTPCPSLYPWSSEPLHRQNVQWLHCQRQPRDLAASSLKMALQEDWLGAQGFVMHFK